MTYPESEEVKNLIEHSDRILIVQADNPDGTSFILWD